MNSASVVQGCLLWVLLVLALPVSAGAPCAQHAHPAAAEAGVVPLLHAEAVADSIPANLPRSETAAEWPHGSEYTAYQTSHGHCADHGHAQCAACCAAVAASPWSVPRQDSLQPWLAGRVPDFAGRHPPPETKPPSPSSLAQPPQSGLTKAA